MKDALGFGRRTPGWFSDVDRDADPAFWISLMDQVGRTSGIQSARDIAMTMLAPRRGERILDVGCGAGDVTLEIARAVAPGGGAIGVDLSQVMVFEATRRAASSDLPVEFRTGDVQRLHFADGTFNACRAERLLAHVRDGASAITEMARVVHPGGRVVLLDVDADSMVIDGGDRRLTRAFVDALAGSIANPWVGRQMRRLLRTAGLASISVAGVVTETGLPVIEPFLENPSVLAERTGVGDAAAWQQWRDELIRADRRGDLYVATAMFVGAGVKP